jgi:pimeloyl-ACP methyl ester carboxylesterase
VGRVVMKNKNSYTIVFLHGWDQSKRVWFHLEKKLSKQYSTFSLDLPGFGEREKPDTDWGIPEYSEWLNNQIEKKKVDNVVLIGHSFGGRIAAYLASKNPTWLQALVLSGTPCLYEPNIQIKFKIITGKLIRNLLPQRFKNLFLSKEDLDAREKGMKKIRYNVITFDQRDFLPNINSPTLIINGEKDRSNPVKIAKKTNNLIPNSKLVIMENLGHNIFIENENLFYGKIQTFIENL